MASGSVEVVTVTLAVVEKLTGVSVVVEISGSVAVAVVSVVVLVVAAFVEEEEMVVSGSIVTVVVIFSVV